MRASLSSSSLPPRETRRGRCAARGAAPAPGRFRVGAGLGVSQFGELCFRANFVIGHPGFAWAARREVITSAGFYDRSIIGGGDRIMLNAFTGHYNGVSRKMPPMMAEDVRAFGARLTPLVGPANMSIPTRP